jgi:protease I
MSRPAADHEPIHESPADSIGGIAMANELNGKRVAFIAANGVEQSELSVPWQAAVDAGARAELISSKPGEIQGVEHDDKGMRFKVDLTFDQASPDDYDGLVIPGGVANPDRLRTDDKAVRFVRDFFDSGKPVAAICHGPWMLVEADIVEGRTVTSWPSLRTDLQNAGANWVDREVVVEQGLVTSRRPDDLQAFCAEMIEEFAEGIHDRSSAPQSSMAAMAAGTR